MHIENVRRKFKNQKSFIYGKLLLFHLILLLREIFFPLGYFFILYNTSFCILFVPSSRCSLFLKTNSLHLRGSIFCSTVILKQDVVAWETNCSNWIVYSEIFWQSHGKFVPFDQNLRQAVAFLNILFLLYSFLGQNVPNWKIDLSVIMVFSHNHMSLLKLQSF